MLVLAGEAGIGKTALLRYATDLAESMIVVETTGLEAEAELEFSGLLDLCRPIVDHLEHIPEHQAALRAALALAPRAERDRFAVGAALLSLFAAVGEQQPPRRGRRRAVARRCVGRRAPLRRAPTPTRPRRLSVRHA